MRLLTGVDLTWYWLNGGKCIRARARRNAAVWDTTGIPYYFDLISVESPQYTRQEFKLHWISGVPQTHF